jgi:hypothetical protein
MLSNEEFALACRAYYEEQGLVVDERNGQFAHSPLTRTECETGYYLLWEHHQHQGLLQSRDLNKCCFFTPDTRNWLLTADYFPDNYFELWDIYEEFASWAVRRMSPSSKANAGRKISQKLKKFNAKLTPEERKEKVKHLHTSEALKKRGKAISLALHNRTSEKKRAHIEKRIASRKKKVEIHFPNGRIGTYLSVSFASRATGIAINCISKWACSGKVMSKDKYKGFSARYV